MNHKKKSLISRIAVLAVAAVMLLGVVVGTIISAVAHTDETTVSVTSFSTGKLSEAINASDYSEITTLVVSGGTLNEQDLYTIKSLGSIQNCVLDGCSIVDNKIPDYAFNGFSSLVSFTFPQNVTVIGDGAFGDCSALANITLPNTLTAIGRYAFQNCSSLEVMTIPDNVTQISEGAFYACGFSSLTLPINIKTIPKNCFNQCGHLTELVIPQNVGIIESWAFADCTSLTRIILEPMDAPKIGSDVFPFDNEFYIMPDAKGYNQGDWLVYYISGEIYDGNITVPVQRPDTSIEDSSDEPGSDISSVEDTSSGDKDSSYITDDDASDVEAAAEENSEDKSDNFILTVIISALGAIVAARLLMMAFNKIDDLSED